ncbi:hypothetical protein A2U01_0111612, partial [Trifolium medium]|nr:hypothetical protein [Trifolium medium]
TLAPAKMPTGVHEVSETPTLSAQVSHIHNMIKTPLTQNVVSVAEPFKVVIEAGELVK